MNRLFQPNENHDPFRIAHKGGSILSVIAMERQIHPADDSLRWAAERRGVDLRTKILRCSRRYGHRSPRT